MILERLFFKKDLKLLSYIEGFKSDDVILKDYFYFTDLDLIKENQVYSDEQIARILNLTDREYAEFADKFLNSSTQEQLTEDVEQDLTSQIGELESKLKKSRDYEDNQKKKDTLSTEIETLRKELSSLRDVDQKLQNYSEEYAKYSKYTKYNLIKIHEDLVSLNYEINKSEEQLLNQKVEEIHNSISKTEYDHGKLVLAAAFLFAGLIVSGFLYFLSIEELIFIISLAATFIITVILIITSRSSVNIYDEDEENENPVPDLKQRLENMRAKRRGVLEMLGLQSTDEFFHLKAKLGSAAKGVKYYAEKKEAIFNELGYSELIKKETTLQTEIASIESKIYDMSKPLNPDEYLAAYRELDSLKLKQGQKGKIQNVEKEDIPLKLKNIRKELSDKLPDYINFLRNQLISSLSDIKQTILNIGVQPDFVENIENNYSGLTSFQKFLIQYALSLQIYKSDFALITENSSKWDEQSRSQLEGFASSNNSNDIKLYLLEEA